MPRYDKESTVEDRKPEKSDKPDEVETVRRREERVRKQHLDWEAIELQKRLRVNAERLLAMDLEDFLRALREDYEISDESQLAAARAFWIQNRRP